MAKKTIFRENYLTHKPNGFTPDEYEKYGRKLDSHSFRKNINNEKENKEPQKESRNMAKNIIRLTEGDLHRIVKESVERILREGGRIPADTQIGRHKFKGLKYDKNGNPIYTHPSKLDDPEGGTLSDDDLKAHGWKFSSKHGLHGQIQDPTRLPK